MSCNVPSFQMDQLPSSLFDASILRFVSAFRRLHLYALLIPCKELKFSWDMGPKQLECMETRSIRWIPMVHSGWIVVYYAVIPCNSTTHSRFWQFWWWFRLPWGDRSEVSMVPLGCPSWNPRHARAHPGLELGDAAVGMGFNGSIIIIIIIIIIINGLV